MRKLLLLLLTFATLGYASTIADVIEKELGLTDAYVWEKKRQFLPYHGDPFRALYGYVLSGDPSLSLPILYDYVYFRHLYRGCFQGSEDSRRWLKLHIGKCKDYEILFRGNSLHFPKGIYAIRSSINRPKEENIALYLSSALAVITDSVLPEFSYSFNTSQGVTPSFSQSYSVSGSRSSPISTQDPSAGSASYSVSYSSGISFPSLTVEEFTIRVDTYIDVNKLKEFLKQEDLNITSKPVFFTFILYVNNIKQFEHPLNLPKVQTKVTGAGVEISQDELLKWFALYRRLSQGFNIESASTYEMLKIVALKRYESHVDVQNLTDPRQIEAYKISCMAEMLIKKNRGLPYSLDSLECTKSSSLIVDTLLEIPNPVVLFQLRGLKDIFTIEDVKALAETLKNDPSFIERMSRDIIDRRVPFKFYTFSKVFTSQ